MILAAVVLCSIFYGCSKSETEEKSEGVTVLTEVPTEEAALKEIDAIHYIEESYTKEELGLDNFEKEYSLMVASNGVEIDGDKYVKVVANVIVRNDTTNEEGKETFTMETVGEYFISFNSKKVLMKDRESGEYKKLENRYDEFVEKNKTSLLESTSHQH